MQLRQQKLQGNDIIALYRDCGELVRKLSMEDNLERNEAAPELLRRLEEYFTPQSHRGKDLYDSLPQRSLLPHERVSLTAWIHLSEVGQAEEEFFKNLTALLGFVSSRRRITIPETREGGVIPPPLLSDEGRSTIRGMLSEFRKSRFLEQPSAQSTIRQGLRLIVSLLVENKLLRKEDEEENTTIYLERLEGEITESSKNPPSF